MRLFSRKFMMLSSRVGDCPIEKTRRLTFLGPWPFDLHLAAEKRRVTWSNVRQEMCCALTLGKVRVQSL